VTHKDAVDTLAAERYLLDEMSDEDRQAFEDHFFSCDVCADDLRTATAMLQGAKAGYAGPSTAGQVVPMVPRPTAVRNPVWYRSVALPWAVAATLAVVAGYQSFFVVPSLRRETPLALIPVTLRPQSRGAEAVVPIDRSGRPIILAVEVNELPQSGEVTYDLSSSSGGHIVSGRAAAPAPGSPLLLLMPAWTLVESMHYILSVHDAGPSGRSLGEYRFVVSAQ
jgi:hypothetical protein